MGFSKALTKNMLKCLKNEEVTKYAAIWVKLHKGAPTDEGTAEAAGETTRKEATLGAITEANPSTVEFSNTPEWTNVGTAETYKAISLWTLEAAGTCLGAGNLETEKTVAIGDNFKLVAGTKITLE